MNQIVSEEKGIYCGWNMVLRLFLLTVLILPFMNGYNILILHPTPSYSHQLPVLALTEALVKRGHQLFVVSPNAVPGLEKNYTFIDMSFSYNTFVDKVTNDKNTINNQRQISKWNKEAFYKVYAAVASKQFNSEPFLRFQKQIAAENISFDVSIVESFFTAHGCGMTRLLAGYNTPIISISSIAYVFWGENELGNPLHLSYQSSFLGSYTDNMNIWQKIENWASHYYIVPRLKNIFDNEAKSYFRETYGPKYEALLDGCYANVSLALISSNCLYFYPRLLGPNVVEVGPMHIKPPPKLQKNLQDWLDGAVNGVVYFSLGSNMKSKSLPENVRANFLKIFKELPSGYRVLWKWELDGEIPGQTDNILTQKWMPQQSILAHPKVKVFITQGGLQSFHEAVHYGIPTVGIPWFGDQESNVAKMIDVEIGTRLLPQDLHSYEKVKSAIETVLYDEKYARNMKRLSAISRDFTAHALDKAVFWVEHIAKHGHAHHLKPSTAGSTYFEFLCLDILAVILVVSVIVLYLIVLYLYFFLSSGFLF